MCDNKLGWRTKVRKDISLVCHASTLLKDCSIHRKRFWLPKVPRSQTQASKEDCDWVLCHYRTLAVTTDEVRDNRLLSQV